MWRVVFIFLAVLVVGNTTGLLPEGDDPQCADEGANNGDGKQCPPSCPTCTCAWHSLKTTPTPVFEVRAIEFSSRTVDLPAPTTGDGQLVPAPTTRPPIA